MGIAGHILGSRKLRQLNQMIPGHNFDRAFNRNGEGAARTIDERGECVHFAIDYRTWEAEKIDHPIHWWSCPLQIIDLEKEYPAEERAKYEALFVEEGFTPARQIGPAVIVRRKTEETS